MAGVNVRDTITIITGILTTLGFKSVEYEGNDQIWKSFPSANIQITREDSWPDHPTDLSMLYLTVTVRTDNKGEAGAGMVGKSGDTEANKLYRSLADWHRRVRRALGFYDMTSGGWIRYVGAGETVYSGTVSSQEMYFEILIQEDGSA